MEKNGLSKMALKCCFILFYHIYIYIYIIVVYYIILLHILRILSYFTETVWYDMLFFIDFFG